MQVFEITGYQTGVSKEGVNYLQPSDSFQNIQNGYIYRQVLQSRRGFKQFSTNRLASGTRIMGIFEHVLRDNTTQLLVVTTTTLYKYNTGTDTFDAIVFAGSVGAGFTITNKAHYVSGTTYPTKTGANRFLFTGPGLSDIYSYDGTDVQSFTLDNLDYAQPIVGATGVITGAWFIMRFGERLNLFNARVGGNRNPQQMLYTGIRDSTGNGDKFLTVGAGAVVADTSEYIQGASILGDNVIINFSRSNWAVDKRNDAFNPYFIRKIPSVIGTDAPFSSVSWDDRTVSVGKTGIIATNSRESKRIDNKIPDFTTDDIDSPEFPLTYGGFDRVIGQFLISYADANAANSTQNKVLVNNYEEGTWSVNDQRFTVFGQTELGPENVWSDIEGANQDSWERWDTTEEIWNKIGLSDTVQKTLAGDDDGFIYELNQDYDDYFVAITGITAASPAVVSTNNQALKAGDRVVISNVEGMTGINNFDTDTGELTQGIYTVASSTVNSVTLDNIDSSNYTAWTAAGSISKVIDFSAEMMPFNPFRSEGRMCHISYVEFLLNTNVGEMTVDVFADEYSTPYIENVVIKPTTILKSREWITMSVNNEANFHTFKFSQISPSKQFQMTNMRIHCSPGGMASD